MGWSGNTINSLGNFEGFGHHLGRSRNIVILRRRAEHQPGRGRNAMIAILW